LLGSAIAVAVTVAVALLAKLAGASYSTDALLWLVNTPGPVRVQVTPLPEESLETTAVIVTDCPCPMVCELPALKLTKIGGCEAEEPQPDRET